MRALLGKTIGPALAALAFVMVSVVARDAAAYPAFQFSSGTTRCGQCHYSPAGGGLLTSWGRDESADTISMGGNGAFLHGAATLPPWLNIGGDFRFAGIANAVGGPASPELVFFPMQLDVYLRFAFGESFSLNVTWGDRGVVRPTDSSTVGRVEALDSFISREHYLMWRPSATGPYMRVGRFFPVYGLRLVEHPFYVRRYTGNNLYEEPYAVAGGYVEEDWEIHLATFAPVPTSFPDQFQSVGYRETGGALYAEKRIAGMVALALQTRIAAGAEEARYQGGAVGKLWVEQAKMLIQGEFDFIHQTITGSNYRPNGVVAYVGPTFFPTRGLMTTFAYERYQPDLSVKATALNAYDLEFNFFPIAHLELLLLGRIQTAGDGPTSTLGMFQIHYYL